VGHPVLNPLAGQRRFDIDVVRGVALFGVLLVNLYSFGADVPAWPGTLDQAAMLIKNLFFESRFWTLFSFLFGLGCWTQMWRIAGDDRSRLPVSALMRRYAVLYLLGGFNALLFDGDILMLYAQAGAMLLLLTLMPTRMLLPLAVLLLLIFPLGHALMSERGGDAFNHIDDAREWLADERADSVYANGSLGSVIGYNAEELPRNPLEDWQWPDSGFAVLGMFVLGFLAGRHELLINTEANRPRLRRLRKRSGSIAIIALLAQWWLTATAGYMVFADTSLPVGYVLVGDLLYVLSTVSLAAFYLFALLLAARKPALERWLRPLANAGRLGLSVYLGQTLIFTTLFYGYGLGWVYKLGPAAVSMLAVAIFAAQLLICSLWLRYFRHGPAEWLWRHLSGL